MSAHLLALLLAAEVPRVSVTASKAEVTVGETFTVEVAAEGPPGAIFTFPGEAGSDEVELSTPARASAVAEGRHRYQAMVFTLGETVVPPITVKYRLPDGREGEVATATIPLKVVSLFPKDPAQQKLSDIRGPLSLAIGRPFWIAIGIGLALVTALTLWLIRRRGRPRAGLAPSLPETPPDVEARSALDRLAASGRAQRGEFRRYYIELVAIAKRYLERRLGAPVLEMTTAETLAFLREGPHAELVGAVRDLSGAADRIKFARGEGLTAEAERHLEAVRSLVRSVEARRLPAEPEKAA